jgi:GTP cyclohydrolase I
MNVERVENLIRELLQEIGENPDRVGLRDTPRRVAKMYQEIFRGYDPNQCPEITMFPNGEDGIVVNSMIIDQSYCFSCCEHHVIPFISNYFYGYVPDQYVIGASKISRVVDFFSARLQVQERLGIQVVNCIEEKAHPLGQILVIRGRHLCKEMRGAKKFNSPFETIEARGIFLTNKDGCKDEFMARISNSNFM